MTPAKIQELLNLGEGQRVEFKTNLRAIDGIGKAVCGFLNTAGGYVVCGIGDRRDIVGVAASDSQLAVFEKKLHDFISPTTLVSVERQNLNGRAVIVIEVPKGPDLPYSFRNVIYIRKGEQTVAADSATIRDMVLRTQIEPERWERRFALADLETDLDPDQIAATVRDAEKVKRAFFHDSRDPVRTLEDLSVARYGRLTNGGDVLFTRNPAVRLPQIRLRAACYNSDKAGETFRDMKSFEGPLHATFEDAYAFIVRNTASVSRFAKGSPKREDSPAYPEAAVREALINALAHRDYSSPSGGVSVHIFPRRLEIWNSGGFPEGVTPESLAKGQISVLRNPDLAHVLYLRGLMEKAGRGSVLIIRQCREHGLPAPQWRSDEKLGVTLTFLAPHVTPHVTPHVPLQVAPHVTRLVRALAGEMSRSELMVAMGIKDRAHFGSAYLRPALAAAMVEMTQPDKPKSSKQRYRLTLLGQAVAADVIANDRQDKLHTD